MPIPPATISFPAIATAHPADPIDRVPGLARLLPADRRHGSTLLEIRPTGHYVTYGLGVPLLDMRNPGTGPCPGHRPLIGPDDGRRHPEAKADHALPRPAGAARP